MGLTPSLKNTLIKIDKRVLPVLPAEIASGRYTWKDVDGWMLGLGAKRIGARERLRLRKAGLVGMPLD